MEADVPTRALSVLIVTHNAASRIGALLVALRAECERNDAEVIVLDNASHDGTSELVWREHPWVFVRRSLTNLGFAAAANLASRFARGRCLLLLQPDALPEPGCLAQGLALMQADAGVAVAGGRLVPAHGTPAAPAWRGPAWMHERLALQGRAARQPHAPLFGRFERPAGDAAGPVEVPWVSGPFLFVRSEAFRSLAGFDERFFLYYEEIDLCRRARAAGWRVCHCPQLQAQPLDGGPPGAHSDEGPQTLPPPGFELATPAADPRHALWHLRSSLLYHRKHHGGVPTWILHRLERAWQALQAWRGRGRPGAAHEARLQLTQLRRAWNDTFGGRVCPPRPW